MSVGIGRQFSASLAPGQTQTWFTWGWDPNYFVHWSVRPTNSPAKVRLERVRVAYEETGITYSLTISNTGPWPATFEARYYFKSIIPEAHWRCVGPNHLSGSILQVALDPNNSDRLYALAQGGGLWKLDSVSNYPSSRWEPLSDQHASLVGFAFAIAPSNSSRIYLAEGSSFLTSPDGGRTWNSASGRSLWRGNGPWTHAVRKVIVDRANENHVFVGSNTGLWETTNGGGRWTQVIAGDITDLAMDPGSSSILYVAQRNVGVLKSTTGGSSWTTILAWNAVTNPADTMVKIALGALGSTTRRTIAVKFDQTVFVNHRSGTGSWTSSTLGSDLGEQQGDWDNVVAVDPFNDNVILAGTQGLRRSHDGGGSWNTVVTYYQPHEDQQCVFFDPRNSGVVYLSNDGGVFRSTDSGQTWMSGDSWDWNDVFRKFDLNYGLVTSLFYRVGISNTDIIGPTAVGPAHHQGILASRLVKSSEWKEIQGHSWESANTYAFQNQNGAFYLVQGSDLFRQLFPGTGTSSDLSRIFPGIGRPNAVCMDNSPWSTTLFIGTSAGTMFFTTNPTASPPTWTQVTAINLPGDPIVSIAFAPSNPGMAYAVSRSGVVFRNNAVTSPQNWVNMGSDWNQDQVVQLAVDPNDDSLLYLISKSRFAKSTNGGAHWVAVPGASAADLGTARFQSVLADPFRAQTVFLAGEPGVFISTDAGQSWAPYNQGLPNASASWLQWYGEYLYVSTWGRGLWRRLPFAHYGDDNVNIVTQFTGTLSPGQTQTWFTWGWPRDWFVVWSVRPTTDHGEVSLDTLDVELEPSGITYHLTITNTGSHPVAFEAKYGFVSF